MRKIPNRIYNCRAKAVETNKWVYGSVFFIGQKGYILTNVNGKRTKNVLMHLGDYAVEIDSKTIGRYIGEDDSARKPIFEGDILLEEIGYGRKLEKGDTEKCYYLIQWAEKYNSFLPVPFENGKLYKKLHLHLETMKAIRYVPFYVVGNIYDNSLNDFESTYYIE